LSNSLMVYDPHGLEKDSPAEAIYDYLRKNILNCPDNITQFRDRVSEAYFEIFSEYNIDVHAGLDEIIPGVADIAERIDSENILGITNCCAYIGFSMEDTDRVLVLYCHNIACYLDDNVNEILWALGYPIRYANKMSTALVKDTSKLNPAQIKLSYWKAWESDGKA